MKPQNEHQHFFEEFDNLEDGIDEHSKRDYEKRFFLMPWETAILSALLTQFADYLSYLPYSYKYS